MSFDYTNRFRSNYNNTQAFETLRTKPPPRGIKTEKKWKEMGFLNNIAGFFGKIKQFAVENETVAIIAIITGAASAAGGVGLGWHLGNKYGSAKAVASMGERLLGKYNVPKMLKLPELPKFPKFV